MTPSRPFRPGWWAYRTSEPLLSEGASDGSDYPRNPGIRQAMEPTTTIPAARLARIFVLTGAVTFLIGIGLVFMAPFWVAALVLVTGLLDLALAALYRTGRLGAQPEQAADAIAEDDPATTRVAGPLDPAEPGVAGNPYARED
jgi:hypothetical protein